MVALNRAVAVSFAEDPESALPLLEVLGRAPDGVRAVPRRLRRRAAQARRRGGRALGLRARARAHDQPRRAGVPRSAAGRARRPLVGCRGGRRIGNAEEPTISELTVPARHRGRSRKMRNLNSVLDSDIWVTGNPHRRRWTTLQRSVSSMLLSQLRAPHPHRGHVERWASVSSSACGAFFIGWWATGSCSASPTSAHSRSSSCQSRSCCSTWCGLCSRCGRAEHRRLTTEMRDGVLHVSDGNVPQRVRLRHSLVRARGWWASGLWIALGYLLCLTVV